jgi:hypothetical protein
MARTQDPSPPQLCREPCRKLCREPCREPCRKLDRNDDKGACICGLRPPIDKARDKEKGWQTCLSECHSPLPPNNYSGTNTSLRPRSGPRDRAIQNGS